LFKTARRPRKLPRLFLASQVVTKLVFLTINFFSFLSFSNSTIFLLFWFMKQLISTLALSEREMTCLNVKADAFGLRHLASQIVAKKN